ncbi:MAG: hypothetical protein AB2L07_13690 [Thermoanaerobaculaceae bacterium]
MTKRVISVVLVVGIAAASLIGFSVPSEGCRPACCGCDYCDSAYYQIEGGYCFIRTWNCIGGGYTEEICV